MNDEQVYDFGIRLRQLREERGLSRTAFAKKLGVSIRLGGRCRLCAWDRPSACRKCAP